MATRPSLTSLALALAPWIAMCFTVPLWDRIRPMVIGLPFNFFWLLLWSVLTPLCMWGAYRIEKSRNAKIPLLSDMPRRPQ